MSLKKCGAQFDYLVVGMCSDGAMLSLSRAIVGVACVAICGFVIGVVYGLSSTTQICYGLIASMTGMPIITGYVITAIVIANIGQCHHCDRC